MSNFKGAISMRVLIKGQDGSVAIMTLAPGADKDEAVKKFKDSHPDGNYGDYFEFEGNLPSSREFRDAWTHYGKNVVVDKMKASNILIERVRHVRNEALDKLDGEQMRHLSNPEELKRLEERKQLLRDLPSKIKSLNWPDELERK